MYSRTHIHSQHKLQLPTPNECAMAELFEQIYALVLPSLNDDTWSDAYSSAYSYLRYACRKNLHQSQKIYISIKFVPPSFNDDTWSDAYLSAFSYLRYAQADECASLHVSSLRHGSTHWIDIYIFLNACGFFFGMRTSGTHIEKNIHQFKKIYTSIKRVLPCHSDDILSDAYRYSSAFSYGVATMSRLQNYRSFLQNIVSFAGLFCKRDL